MKPISNETKARYFDLYRGQRYITDNGEERILCGAVSDMQISGIEPSKRILLLRSLHRITDEESFTIARILDFDRPYQVNRISSDHFRLHCNDINYITFHKMGNIVMNLHEEVYTISLYNSIYIHQYLQSIGIALPFYSGGETYSVSDLVESGVIKLIEA